MKLLRAAALVALLPSFVSAANIILIRHAERASAMTSDAPLSPAGEERAQLLAQVLKDAHIQRIYVTEVLRTQQTAAPLAAKLHLKPVVIAQKDSDALVKQLEALGGDETVLVVGHTDTIPLLVERLGGGSVPPIGDAEYDRMTILVTGAGKAHVVTIRYGKVTEE